MSKADTVVLDRPHLRFIIATIVVCAAFLLRYAISHYLGVQLPPFITFYPAVMVIAGLFGLWAGVLAAALSSVLVTIFIFPRSDDLRLVV